MKGYRLLFTCTSEEHAHELLASRQYAYEPKPAVVRKGRGVLWEAWVPARGGGYRYTGSEAGCYS